MRVVWVHQAGVLAALVTLAGCSWMGAGSLPQGNSSQEWRAAWVLNLQDDVKDAASARQLVQEARALRLNALFVPVISEGVAFYPSQIAPVFVPPGSYRPLEYDLLQLMLDAAKENRSRPVKIFAWVSFCHVWQGTGLLPPSHPVVQHSDWVTAHYDANRPPDTVPDFWLDPGIPAVQQYAGEICRELAARYDRLDGILLDGVQYQAAEYGYNTVALQRFAKETGRPDRPTPGDPLWRAWKARQITNLLERMSLSIRAQRTTLPVGVVGVAEGPIVGGFEESLPFADGGQNWLAWLKDDLVDLLVLRDFKRRANNEQAKEFTDWLGYARIHSAGKALVCGISARDNPILATQEQVLQARAAGYQGVAFWNYRDSNTEGRPHKALFEQLETKVFKSWAAPPVIPWLRHPSTGMVAGQVRDASLMPMSNVRVYFPELERETYTHADGSYVLFQVPSGLRTRPQAYWHGKLYPAEQAVTVVPGSILIADIAVTP